MTEREPGCTCPMPKFSYPDRRYDNTVFASNLPTLRDAAACPVHRHLVIRTVDARTMRARRFATRIRGNDENANP